jgi:hypothetical protein
MYLQPEVLLHAQWLEGGDTDGRLRRFCRPTRIILEGAIRIIDKYVEKPPDGQVRFCSIAGSHVGISCGGVLVERFQPLVCLSVIDVPSCSTVLLNNFNNRLSFLGEGVLAMAAVVDIDAKNSWIAFLVVTPPCH